MSIALDLRFQISLVTNPSSVALSMTTDVGGFLVSN